MRIGHDYDRHRAISLMFFISPANWKLTIINYYLIKDKMYFQKRRFHTWGFESLHFNSETLWGDLNIDLQFLQSKQCPAFSFIWSSMSYRSPIASPCFRDSSVISRDPRLRRKILNIRHRLVDWILFGEALRVYPPKVFVVNPFHISLSLDWCCASWTFVQVVFVTTHFRYLLSIFQVSII